MKLSPAQERALRRAPVQWARKPFGGDSRPIPPLERMGLIELRNVDVTPEDWQSGPVRIVRSEWRITHAGLTALADALARNREMSSGEGCTAPQREPNASTKIASDG